MANGTISSNQIEILLSDRYLDSASDQQLRLKVKFAKDSNETAIIDKKKYGGSVVGAVSLYYFLDTPNGNGEFDEGSEESLTSDYYLCDAENDWTDFTTSGLCKWSNTTNFMTQPSKFALCGEGFNVGRDGGQPVSPDYVDSAPYEFEGATLKDVVVKIYNDAEEVNADKEFMGMLLRD